MERNIFKPIILVILITMLDCCFIDNLKAQIPHLQVDTNSCFHNPKDSIFHSIAHPAPNIVYLSGSRGVYKSYDNGDTWSKIYSYPSDSAFIDLYFLDENIGYAHRGVPYDNPNILFTDSLFKTFDGGYTWQSISSTAPRELQFIGQDTIVGIGSGLVGSFDGGYTWTKLLNQSIHSFTVLDDKKTIYAVHGAGSYSDANEILPKIRVYKSTDFGNWWTTVYPQNYVPDSPNDLRVPYEVSYSYFWGNGRGVIDGHKRILTKNDFDTYNVKDAFSFDDKLVNRAYLKSGHRVVLYCHDLKDEEARVDLSASFGWNSGSLYLAGVERVMNWSHSGISACEQDTTFFLFTTFWNDQSFVYRITPADFDALNLYPLNVPNVKANATVTVSPNPTSGVFSVSCDKPLKNIAVFDLQGKEIYSRKCDNEENVTIDAIAWVSGTYIVRIQTKDGFGEAKVVKK